MKSSNIQRRKIIILLPTHNSLRPRGSIHFMHLSVVLRSISRILSAFFFLFFLIPFCPSAPNRWSGLWAVWAASPDHRPVPEGQQDWSRHQRHSLQTLQRPPGHAQDNREFLSSCAVTGFIAAERNMKKRSTWKELVHDPFETRLQLFNGSELQTAGAWYLLLLLLLLLLCLGTYFYF